MPIMKPNFTLIVTPLNGAARTVAGNEIATLDAAVEDGNFSAAELRLSIKELPNLAKLNVGAILLKGRQFISMMATLQPDTTSSVRTTMNPFFQGTVRFSGKALAKFIHGDLAAIGYTFNMDTEELIFNFSGVEKFVVMAASRRLINIVKFSSTFTRRLNSTKKFRWETFDSISRLCAMPVAETVVTDDGEPVNADGEEV